MNIEEPVKRRYESRVRDSQARATRLAVIAAASRLFEERGYVATSIDDIAAASGVSRATVFTSVGGKPAVLKAAFDVAIVGDDEPIALPDRDYARPVRDEPDPRRTVALFASLMTDLGARLTGISEALRGAAHADPEARALWEKAQADRRQGAANFIALLSAKGPLRPDLEPDIAADIVFALNDPSLHRVLVHDRGWPIERFRAWLIETMTRALLPAE
jgi:TetR/AcrR family transcriptional regulator, regulator of autoinduction and epiphytic fitness